MFSTEDFDYLVVGNEPAGLWLLKQLHKTESFVHSRPKLGWIPLGPKPKPCPFPLPFCSLFGIEPQPTWHIELVTPRETFWWCLEDLQKRFPTPLWEKLRQTSPEERLSQNWLALAGRALSDHPDLLAYAQGIWKAMGRTVEMGPESVLRAATLCMELGWWEYAHGLEEYIPETVASGIALTQIQTTKGGPLSIGMEDGTALLSQAVILNADSHTLTTSGLISADLTQQAGLNFQIQSRFAHYPFQIVTQDEGIPEPAGPMTCYFESLTVPDAHREVWLYEQSPGDGGRKTLTLRISENEPLYLESLCQSFIRGVQIAEKMFPFLVDYTESYSVSLNLGSCFSAEQRNATTQALLDNRIELYEFSRLDAKTRLRSLYAFHPCLKCFLPYPLGTLMTAKSVLRELLRPKKRQPQATEQNQSRS